MLILADAMGSDRTEHKNLVCFLSQRKIAERTGLSITTVKKVVRELKQARTPLIAVRQPPPFKQTVTRGHRHRSAAFTLVRYPEKYAAVRQAAKRAEPAPAQLSEGAGRASRRSSDPASTLQADRFGNDTFGMLARAMIDYAGKAGKYDRAEVEDRARSFVMAVRHSELGPESVVRRVLDDPDQDRFLRDPDLWTVETFRKNGPLA
jgi:hypothetical protein